MIITFKPGTSEDYKKRWYKKHGIVPDGTAEGVEKPSPKSDKQKIKKGRRGANSLPFFVL